MYDRKLQGNTIAHMECYFSISEPLSMFKNAIVVMFTSNIQLIIN